jgi:hypothetical protein
MRRSTLLLAAFALLSAFGRDPILGARSWSVRPSEGAAARNASEQSDLAALRSASASFQKLEAARSAGWSAKIAPCVTDSAGGLGVPYANPAIIDGSVSVERPELLLYEPAPNGAKRLVGVEYIVPLSAWTSPEPPRLFGRAFEMNVAFGIWALHVWAWKDNPSGLYADWNPRVNCLHTTDLSMTVHHG